MRTPPSPTVPPPQPEGLNSALARNIRALQARRRQEIDAASAADKVAGRITAFAGSMAFVYLHLVIVAAWVAINLGLVPGAPQFDKSFVILATAASVEAIFLSTFVLISQNRSAEAEDRRANLDLQVNLLAEHEITRLIGLTSAIAAHLGITEAKDEELAELERDIAPETVLDTLQDVQAGPRGDGATAPR
jgi:uncharacterized membrane protein